jgi:hypothetical protein
MDLFLIIWSELDLILISQYLKTKTNMETNVGNLDQISPKKVHITHKTFKCIQS